MGWLNIEEEWSIENSLSHLALIISGCLASKVYVYNAASDGAACVHHQQIQFELESFSSGLLAPTHEETFAYTRMSGRIN